MYLRPHSKSILTKSIRDDTAFLSSNLVMDYSLLVGVDETNHQLVIGASICILLRFFLLLGCDRPGFYHKVYLLLGIIDYIRTFTWDKKLETLVKSTVLGAGQGPPTVVSPEVYRNRFLEAMDRYFLLVPDKWSSVRVVN